jgi:hypothetical protein
MTAKIKTDQVTFLKHLHKHFVAGRKLYNGDDIKLVLNSVHVPVVSGTKYLGLKMKNNLNFK